MSHHDYSSKKANPSDGFSQARNQLGAPGGVKSFLREAQISEKICPIIFNYANIFFQWGRNVLQGRLRTPSPLVTGLCPIALKYVQHIFPVGPKIFLASYGPGFARYCCIDRLAIVQALKMNVHLSQR